MKRKHYDYEDYRRELYKDAEVKKQSEKEFAELVIAHKIIELREKAHMSQAQLAKELHTKQQVVSRLEGENYKPSLNTLEKVARVFGKRVEINFV